MTRNHTAVCYGIAIRTFPLFYAIDAWPKLAQPFRFLDLISLRIKQGTLNARGKAVERLPKEVWDIIKLELANKEVKDAREALIWGMGGGVFGCPCCYDRPSKPLTWENLALAVMNDPDELYDYQEWGERGMWSGTRRKELDTLLRPFGLSLSQEDVVKTNPSLFFDFASATLLTLRSTKFEPADDRTIEARWGEMDQPDGQAILELPPSPPFQLDQARSCFLSLVKLMDLEVVDLSTPPYKPDLSTAKDDKEKKATRKKALRRFKTIPLREIEPMWIVYTTCFYNY